MVLDAGAASALSGDEPRSINLHPWRAGGYLIHYWVVADAFGWFSGA